MAAVKRVIIKKIRGEDGDWRFVSLKRAGTRYAWDDRPGKYFVEWWEGSKRRRESPGQTPSEAMDAQRRKRNELIGERLLGGKSEPPAPDRPPMTLLTDALDMFWQHVRGHSPDKPGKVRRYREVLPNQEIEKSPEHGYLVVNGPGRDAAVFLPLARFTAPGRFVIVDVGPRDAFHTPKFKRLKDPRAMANRRPPTYRQEETDRMFAECDQRERAIFASN